jgi:hypothetical protein
MTEDQLDEVYEKMDLIHDTVHALVDKILTNSDPEVEDLVRLKLTEEFRFWKRINSSI